MTTKQYPTTVGRALYDTRFFGSSEPVGWQNPIPPDGEGWELVSSAAMSHPMRLFWFWERSVSKTRYTLTVDDETGIYESQFDTLEKALADAKAMYPDIPKDWDGFATCVFGPNRDAAYITSCNE